MKYQSVREVFEEKRASYAGSAGFCMKWASVLYMGTLLTALSMPEKEPVASVALPVTSSAVQGGEKVLSSASSPQEQGPEALESATQNAQILRTVGQLVMFFGLAFGSTFAAVAVHDLRRAKSYDVRKLEL